MTGGACVPGAAVVARLNELPGWEAELVINMRLWAHGAEGRQEIDASFSACFGPVEGQAHLDRFASFLAVLSANVRRPIAWHGLNCMCVGSDEAVIVALVREAGRGELHEASMIAAILLRAALAETVALMAAQASGAQRRLARHHAPPKAPAAPSARLH